MTVGCALLEQFPDDAEDAKFSEVVVVTGLRLLNSEATMDYVAVSILRGFDRLLLSFTLGPVYRESIASAARLTNFVSLMRSLAVIELTTTCMITASDDRAMDLIRSKKENAGPSDHIDRFALLNYDF